MTADTSVKVYQSTDAGAPALSGTVGALIAVLDACLTTGYGSVTLDSVVVAGNVATCTKSAGHGFAMLGTTGPVIRIAGATPAGLNGDWRVTVVSPTVFTFPTTGISDQTATGTITALRAPLGFSKSFSGTNKAAYRSNDITGTRLSLRVDDSGAGSAQYSRVRGYETMSDVDTGAGLYPTDAQLSGGGYWYKSSLASSTARAWTIAGDSRGFALFLNTDGTTNRNVSYFFGDIASDHAADAYCSLLIAGEVATANTTFQSYSSSAGHFMARAYTQIGTAIKPIKYGHIINSANGMGYAGADYPNPGNNFFLCGQVDVWDSSAAARGGLPGLYSPLHPAASLTDGMIIPSVAGLTGRELLIKRLYSASVNYAVAIDITGPWR